MSKSTVIVNGENTSDVVEFTNDANINMVAVNDISCTKHLDKDSGQQLLSYPCEFDHIYASSMNDGSKSKTVTSELNLLKELLLSHLDLIQQQSEQLVTKDKQISALQQENATVRVGYCFFGTVTSQLTFLLLFCSLSSSNFINIQYGSLKKQS